MTDAEQLAKLNTKARKEILANEESEAETKGIPASDLKHPVSTTGIDLGKLISDVVPENSLLWKDSGTWFYYEDETTFDEGWEPEYMQEPSESFEKFIRRIVSALVEEEVKEEDEHMVISTDLAIARSKYNGPANNRRRDYEFKLEHESARQITRTLLRPR